MPNRAHVAGAAIVGGVAAVHAYRSIQRYQQKRYPWRNTKAARTTQQIASRHSNKPALLRMRMDRNNVRVSQMMSGGPKKVTAQTHGLGYGSHVYRHSAFPGKVAVRTYQAQKVKGHIILTEHNRVISEKQFAKEQRRLVPKVSKTANGRRMSKSEAARVAALARWSGRRRGH